MFEGATFLPDLALEKANIFCIECYKSCVMLNLVDLYLLYLTYFIGLAV